MKIRRNHRGKHYRYNVNRKTLRRTRGSTGKIKDPVLKKLWEDKRRPGQNFYDMGLASDPNKAIPIPNYKQDRLKVTKFVHGFLEEELDTEVEPQSKEKARKPRKEYVAKQLEEMAKQRAPSEFRLPKGVVASLTYFLDKHQLNYKAMAADSRNHDQWTWKQFRMKIRRFMSIPEQFNKYLAKHGLEPQEKLPWIEYDSDGEWK